MEAYERPYKKVCRAKAMFLFIFSQKAFVKYAAEHDIAWELTVSPDLLEKYQKGEYKPSIEEHEANAKNRAALLRSSLLNAALIVSIAAIIGVVTGVVLQKQLGSLSTFISNLLQAVAVGIILWATLWQLSRDAQSIGGGSLPERLHSWIFNSLYTVGTFILFIVYRWQA